MCGVVVYIFCQEDGLFIDGDFVCNFFVLFFCRLTQRFEDGHYFLNVTFRFLSLFLSFFNRCFLTFWSRIANEHFRKVPKSRPGSQRKTSDRVDL